MTYLFPLAAVLASAGLYVATLNSFAACYTVCGAGYDTVITGAGAGVAFTNDAPISISLAILTTWVQPKFIPLA